ncbi:MAG: hypothetical protein HY884_00310 [Deltaproteobacteria bacterium]|nr:hypothetical protein [Deltaproteobacteria bacterium]
MTEVKAGDDLFFTATMAEVLEKQGYFEDALTIYKILLDSGPADKKDEVLRVKVDALKGLAERGKKRASMPPHA